MQYKSQIETPTESYVTRYQFAVDFAIEQMDVYWPAHELGLEEDELHFKFHLNEAELDGILTAQSILTKYELLIGGEDFWGGRIAKLFPRPEIQRMCAAFAVTEQNSHAPFYAIGNQIMGKDTDEFYSQWKHDPILSDRINFINSFVQEDDALVVSAVIAFLEGAVLMTNFGFFKCFNSRGHNYIPRFGSGIDGSTKDEDFHSRASAYLFGVCRAERIESNNHSAEDESKLREIIWDIAKAVYEHEKRIIKLLFRKPGNRVCTEEDLLSFCEDRINVVLNRLGSSLMFDKTNGVISSLFYNQLSTTKIPDFFSTSSLQYRRNWNKNLLKFKQEIVNDYNY